MLADVSRCWQVLQLAKAMEAQDFATVSKVQQESVPQTDNTSRRKIRGSSGSEKRGRQIVFFSQFDFNSPFLLVVVDCSALGDSLCPSKALKLTFDVF